jgi:PD-(D/E)XK nuclease superfamily
MGPLVKSSPFTLPSFLSLRNQEGHEGPRRSTEPAHHAQLQTYLRVSSIPVGLLLNFHAKRLKDGLRRFVG